MVDDDGDTRAERNERFGVFVDIPEPEPPEAVIHVWAWFWQWAGNRKSDEAMGWSELQDWKTLTAVIIEQHEVLMMQAMDRAYVSCTRSSRKELKERSESRANAFK
jgi:hypothetical protein